MNTNVPSFTLAVFSAADFGGHLHLCRDRKILISALIQVHHGICRPLATSCLNYPVDVNLSWVMYRVILTTHLVGNLYIAHGGKNSEMVLFAQLLHSQIKVKILKHGCVCQ